MLDKRRLGRPLVGFRLVLGDSKKDLGSGGEFSFECF